MALPGTAQVSLLATDKIGILGTDGALVHAVAYATEMHRLLPSQGTLSARLSLTLPRNAVVDAFEVAVTAHRADEAPAAAVAELRGTGLSSTLREIIVDFGTVRTVAAVRFALAAFVQRVDAWNGVAFPDDLAQAAFTAFTPLAAGSIPNEPFALFRSDRRTERLRITVASTATPEALMEALSVVLPDSPRDLTVTVNGGAPVVALAGPAVRGEGSALTAADWNRDGKRLVDLTAAVAALTGDPLATDDVALEIVLASREAGVLEIAEHRRALRRIRRAAFAGTPSTRLGGAEEGVSDLPLLAPGTPAGAVAGTVALTLTAAFGAERRVPPAGPDPEPGLDDPAAPLAALTLSPERALLFRAPVVPGLPALSGLRLLVAAGEGGAELRLVPWSNAGPGLVQPAAPLPGPGGAPLALDPGPPAWADLAFAEPLATDPADPPWIALHVTRGSATLGLARSGAAPLLLGPPPGPWRALPPLFARAPFAGLGVPARAVGAAAGPEAPPPLRLGIAGTPLALPATPGPRGLRLVLSGFAAAAPRLVLTRFAPGEVTLSDIDITTDI